VPRLEFLANMNISPLTVEGLLNIKLWGQACIYAFSISHTHETMERSSRKKLAHSGDRIHAAMLLQASGQTNALRALLKAEQDRGPDFIRLANAFSALYPKQSEEKRLLDAMLLAMPR
jgi:hypothetical protein